MAQYIPKDALVAEIDSIYRKYEKQINFEYMSTADFMCFELRKLSSFINTLEVKEVDLEKELNRYINSAEYVYNEIRDSYFLVAKHFFELGMRVNNPITAEDRGTAEEIIINLKQVEEEYQIDLTKEKNWVLNKVQKGE